MSKKLKLWNGRGYAICRKHSDPRWAALEYNADAHAYVAAYSKADAVRVIAEYMGYEPRGAAQEISKYWSEGAWGDSMAGIVPERGLWLQFVRHGVPERVA